MGDFGGGCAVTLEPVDDPLRDDGAVVLSTLYSLQDTGQLEGTTVSSIVDTVVAFGYLTATLTCSQSFVAVQDMEVACDDDVLGQAVRASEACRICREGVAAALANRLQLEQDAQATNGRYTPQEPHPDLLNYLKGNQEEYATGSCRYVCQQCVARNIEQNLSVQVNASCDVGAATFRQAFADGMNAQARATMVQHQAQMEEALSQINAARERGGERTIDTDPASVAVHISNTLSQVTSTRVLNQLHQQAVQVQSVRILPGSTSVVLHGVNQELSLGAAASLVSQVVTEQRLRTAIGHDVSLAQVTEAAVSAQQAQAELDNFLGQMKQLLVSAGGRLLLALAVAAATILVLVLAVWRARRTPQERSQPGPGTVADLVPAQPAPQQNALPRR